ncbi:MAG TPA: hypothetical protein VKX17_17660 [Planctomycetota bacterium]|nr:hypothetical protein [Planctomycetota bacterium]
MSKIKWLALAVMFTLGLMAASAHAADTGKKPDDPVPKTDPPKKKDPKDMNADEANDAGLCPVCKGEFKPVYHFEYKDKEYHFRTRDCQKQFAANPTKFGAIGSAWKSPPDSTKPDDTKKDDKKPAPK